MSYDKANPQAKVGVNGRHIGCGSKMGVNGCINGSCSKPSDLPQNCNQRQTIQKVKFNDLQSFTFLADMYQLWPNAHGHSGVVGTYNTGQVGTKPLNSRF